jgi:UDP-N-acetylglucosamine 2-epimerase (non-hydrolysing)
MNKKSIALVFGTRPEAVKMAALCRVIKNSKVFKPLIILTAQHRQMLDQVMNIFGLSADYDLDLMKPGQTIDYVVSASLGPLMKIFERENPVAVLVHGDTSTTFAASLASYYCRIPVGHVEAGLRTDNIYSPFPEEMNRRLTGALSTFHFAPTSGARDNLLKENISNQAIAVTGNTVIDALLWALQMPFEFEDKALKNFLDTPEKLILVTAHRRENHGKPLENLFKDLLRLVSERKDVKVIYPVHPNPKVLEPARRLLDHERIFLTHPQEYLSFINLMKESHIILTDSGGLQEEGPALGKPVLVFRDTTERPEAVAAGTARLLGLGQGAAFNSVSKLLKFEDEYNKMAKAVNPFGDGKASARILQFLEKNLITKF